MEIQESLGCSSKVGSSSRAEACDPQLSQQNNLAQPFCSFRSSIDRMMPTHTGEGHLLYSVHTVVIVQWLSRVFVGTYSNANLFQSHPHGYNQKQCLTIYPLTEAVLAQYHDAFVLHIIYYAHAHNTVSRIIVQYNASHTSTYTTHRTNLRFIESYGTTASVGNDDFVVAVCQLYRYYAVILQDVDSIYSV